MEVRWFLDIADSRGDASGFVRDEKLLSAPAL